MSPTSWYTHGASPHLDSHLFGFAGCDEFSKLLAGPGPQLWSFWLCISRWFVIFLWVMDCWLIFHWSWSFAIFVFMLTTSVKVRINTASTNVFAVILANINHQTMTYERLAHQLNTSLRPNLMILLSYHGLGETNFSIAVECSKFCSISRWSTACW